MNLSRIMLASGLAAALTTASLGVASAQPSAAPTVVAQVQPDAGIPHHMRGEHRSDRNIRVVRRHLERVIDQLQRDQHDYAGHRVAAISDLQKARAELLQAEQTDATTKK